LDEALAQLVGAAVELGVDEDRLAGLAAHDLEFADREVEHHAAGAA
jgi:hypothetical protein